MKRLCYSIIIVLLILSVSFTGFLNGRVSASTLNAGTASGGVSPADIKTPVMYENYTTSNAIDIFYGVYQKGQTFIPQTTHTLTKVRLPLIRRGNPSGYVRMSIRETDAGGFPTGSELAASYLACASITNSWSKIWYDFDFGLGCVLYAGTKYAITLEASGADSSNPLYYWVNTSGTYTNGWVIGGSGGTNWYDLVARNWDAAFEEWGLPGIVVESMLFDFPCRLTADGIKVTAFISPGNSVTMASVIWGTSGTEYPYETTPQQVASGAFYDFYINGLTPGTPYYYMVKVVQDIVQYGPQRSVTPWPDTPAGKIAYVHSSGIYLMDPDGTDAVFVTNGFNPAISPDGSKIAFTNGDICTVNIDGSNLQTLTGGISTDYPAWSPDGTKIAFTVYNSDEVWTMNADGTGLVKLADGRCPSWSPDGAKIAFVSNIVSGVGGHVCTINADGTDLQFLTDGAACANPAWSPDGTRLVFAQRQPGGDPLRPVYAIVVIDSDGTFLYQFGASFFISSSIDPAWSPDGQYIVFTAYCANSTPIVPAVIYVADADGSNIVRLMAYDQGYFGGPDWGPAVSLPVNHPPALDPIGAKTVTAGQLLQFTVTASDPDIGDVLTCSAYNLPPGSSFSPVTNTFIWANPVVGVYPGVRFEVTDGEFTDSEDITITVTPVSVEEVMYENYTISNAIDSFYGIYWKGQTFIPDTTHTLTKVRLPLIRRGSVAIGNVMVSIRATDANGRPAGTLAVGTIPCSGIAVTWSKIWYEINLGAGCEVQAGTKYAIVWVAPDMNSSNPMYYFVNTAGTYADGWTVGSIGGNTWYDLASRSWDANFEEWGVSVPVYGLILDLPCQLTSTGIKIYAYFGVAEPGTIHASIIWGTNGIDFPNETTPQEVTDGYNSFSVDGLTPGVKYYYKMKVTDGVVGYGAVRDVVPWVSTPAGKIAYELDGAIYLMDPDGGNLVFVVNGYAPAISPDGSKIAFSNGDICTVDIDGSNLQTLTGGISTDHPVWSPDGSKIAFTASDPVEVWIMSADGTGQVKLADGYDPDWSPDGTKIVFASPRVGLEGGQICTINADGTGLRVLTSEPWSLDPDWSPDGTKIAFGLFFGNPSRPSYLLRIINPDGVLLGQFGEIFSWSSNQNPSWSPDGQYIVFTAYCYTSAPPFWGRQIYVANADGSNAIRLFDYDPYKVYLSPDWGPAWTPPVNHPPVLDPIGNKTVTEGELLQFTVTASDPDVGDELTYAASNLPGDAEFDEATRTFTWLAPVVGVYPGVHFEVTDGEFTDSEDITITVTPVSGTLTLYENYTDVNALDLFYGLYWKGQTFIPQTDHTITKVRLPLLRRGNPGGVVQVSIFENYPDGAPLATGSIACSSLSDSWSQIWYDIDLGAGCTVTAGMTYWIVISAPDADSGNLIYYWVNTSGTYADGSVWNCYADDPLVWSEIAGGAWDAVFEIWGLE